MAAEEVAGAASAATATADADAATASASQQAGPPAGLTPADRASRRHHLTQILRRNGDLIRLLSVLSKVREGAEPSDREHSLAAEAYANLARCAASFKPEELLGPGPKRARVAVQTAHDMGLIPFAEDIPPPIEQDPQLVVGQGQAQGRLPGLGVAPGLLSAGRTSLAGMTATPGVRPMGPQSGYMQQQQMQQQQRLMSGQRPPMTASRPMSAMTMPGMAGAMQPAAASLGLDLSPDQQSLLNLYAMLQTPAGIESLQRGMASSGMPLPGGADGSHASWSMFRSQLEPLVAQVRQQHGPLVDRYISTVAATAPAAGAIAGLGGVGGMAVAHQQQPGGLGMGVTGQGMG